MCTMKLSPSRLFSFSKACCVRDPYEIIAFIEELVTIKPSARWTCFKRSWSVIIFSCFVQLSRVLVRCKRCVQNKTKNPSSQRKNDRLHSLPIQPPAGSGFAHRKTYGIDCEMGRRWWKIYFSIRSVQNRNRDKNASTLHGRRIVLSLRDRLARWHVARLGARWAAVRQQ